jgi:hypothetical protein
MVTVERIGSPHPDSDGDLQLTNPNTHYESEAKAYEALIRLRNTDVTMAAHKLNRLRREVAECEFLLNHHIDLLKTTENVYRVWKEMQ